MSRIFCFAFVALALFIQNYVCADEPVDQIKALYTKLRYYNPEYVKELEYHVTEHNATYNNIGLYWNVIKDLPEDVTVYNEVYVTDESGENPELILKVDVPICHENKYRELLPKVAVVEESELDTKCMKKRIYDPEDMGQFRYEVLIPDLLSKGKYYRLDNRVGTETETVLKVSFYSEWGYLNAE